MNRLRLFAISIAVAALAGAAFGISPAGNCPIGPGLGATLLFPYFELDTNDPLNVTTIISINNGLNSPALTRVVVWTDWGVPTIAFDVWLDAFDVQTLNVRDMFNGVLPSTGTGADLSAFAFCASLPPFHANPVLTSAQRSQLAADHTGVEGPLSSLCAGSFHADQVATGYITVDVVDECSGVEGYDPNFTPKNTTYPYFANGTSAGIAINTNKIWGDVVYIDVNNAAAQGSEAIALWADATQFVGTGIYTFYGRLSGWDGRDDRVPLPRMWDQRFLNGGTFSGGADLIVWRDPEALPSYPICGGSPGWFPLATTVHNALDEEGDTNFSFGNNHFPASTQRVSVGSLGIPLSFGWIQLAGGSRQMWVQPTLGAAGLFSASWNGIPVNFNCGARP